MPVSTHRLLDAIEQLAGTTREVAPGVCESVAILLQELRQRESLDALRARYAEGYRLLAAELRRPDLDDALIGAFAALPAQLEAGREWSAYRSCMERLMEVIARFCTLHAWPTAQDATYDTAVTRLLAWEGAEHAPHCVPDARIARPAIDAASLQAAIRHAGGAYTNVRVTHETVLGGGLSKTMVLFDAEGVPGGTERLVARIESDLPVLEDVYRGMHIPHEYHLIRYLWRNGIPVAEPKLLVGDDNPLARHLFLSAYLPGKIKADFRLALQNLSAEVSNAVASTLALVHHVPVDLHDSDLQSTHIAIDPPRDRREANLAFVAALERDWRNWKEPVSPLIVTALGWLRAHAPGAGQPACIVHGDCGLNNLMFDGDRMLGVLDWEAAHYGDPAEDVCWFLYTLEGIADPAAFIDAYVAAGGERPDAFTLHYMAVLARLKLLFVRDSVAPRYERFGHARPALAVASFAYGPRTMNDLTATLRRAEAVRTDNG